MTSRWRAFASVRAVVAGVGLSVPSASKSSRGDLTSPCALAALGVRAPARALMGNRP